MRRMYRCKHAFLGHAFPNACFFVCLQTWDAVLRCRMQARVGRTCVSRHVSEVRARVSRCAFPVCVVISMLLEVGSRVPPGGLLHLRGLDGAKTRLASQMPTSTQQLKVPPARFSDQVVRLVSTWRASGGEPVDLHMLRWLMRGPWWPLVVR